MYPAFLPPIEGAQTGGVERGINRALGPCSHPPARGRDPGPWEEVAHSEKARCRHLYTVKITTHKWRPLESSIVAPGRRERRARLDPPKGNSVRWASEREWNARPAKPVSPEREDAVWRVVSLERPDGTVPQGSSTAAADGNNGLVAPACERGGHVSRWSGQVGEMLVASAAM